MQKKKPRAAIGQYHPGYWANRSDFELLTNELSFIGDPERLENVVEVILDTDEVPRIEYTYDTRGGEMVRCRHCKVSAKNHHRGFVLRYEDGSRLLFGKDCGEKQYGEAFAHHEREFTAAVKRAALLKRRQHLIEQREAFVRDFERIAGDPCWRAYRELKRSFFAAFSDLIDDLDEAAQKRDGALYGDIQVVDHEAEDAYERRTGRKVSIPKRAHVVVHRLAGRDFYDIRHRPDEAIASLTNRAIAALHQLDRGDKSDHDLRVAFQGIIGLVQAIEQKASTLGELPDVFAPTNIDGISRWLQSQSIGHGEMRLEGRHLNRCNKKGHVREAPGSWLVPGKRMAEVHLPDVLPTPPMAMILNLRSSLQAEATPAQT
jgi:hypothetical protein